VLPRDRTFRSREAIRLKKASARPQSRLASRLGKRRAEITILPPRRSKSRALAELRQNEDASRGEVPARHDTSVLEEQISIGKSSFHPREKSGEAGACCSMQSSRRDNSAECMENQTQPIQLDPAIGLLFSHEG
jgi:hypothetical protein